MSSNPPVTRKTESLSPAKKSTVPDGKPRQGWVTLQGNKSTAFLEPTNVDGLGLEDATEEQKVEKVEKVVVRSPTGRAIC